MNRREVNSLKVKSRKTRSWLLLTSSNWRFVKPANAPTGIIFRWLRQRRRVLRLCKPRKASTSIITKRLSLKSKSDSCVNVWNCWRTKVLSVLWVKFSSLASCERPSGTLVSWPPEQFTSSTVALQWQDGGHSQRVSDVSATPAANR